METLKNEIRNFMEDETGMGTVEIKSEQTQPKLFPVSNF